MPSKPSSLNERRVAASGRPKKQAAQHWEVLDSKEIYSAPPWIRLIRQRLRLPDGRVIEDYHQIRLVDFIVVFARTPDGKLIMERQYKHGIGRECLFLPSGAITDGEDPLAAAQRELLEETGYAAEHWQSLGRFIANANYGCGYAHFFAARNARRVAQPNSGDIEQMEILLLPPAAVRMALRNGEIGSLSVVAALALASDPDPSASRTSP